MGKWQLIKGLTRGLTSFEAHSQTLQMCGALIGAPLHGSSKDDDMSGIENKKGYGWSTEEVWVILCEVDIFRSFQVAFNSPHGMCGKCDLHVRSLKKKEGETCWFVSTHRWIKHSKPQHSHHFNHFWALIFLPLRSLQRAFDEKMQWVWNPPLDGAQVFFIWVSGERGSESVEVSN